MSCLHEFIINLYQTFTLFMYLFIYLLRYSAVSYFINIGLLFSGEYRQAGSDFCKIEIPQAKIFATKQSFQQKPRHHKTDNNIE